MPPKSDAPAKSAATKADEALTPEGKLMWAVLCQLAKDGKIGRIDWEEVAPEIEASTGHASRLRWDAFKKKMKARGSELPSARAPDEAKAKVTKPKTPKTPKATNGVKKPRGKKVKEVAEAAASEEAEASGGEGEEVQDNAENESS